MRVRIPCVTAGLFGFILTVFLLLGQFDFVVAAPDPVLYDQAQKAERGFLATLETLVNIDSGTGDRFGADLKHYPLAMEPGVERATATILVKQGELENGTVGNKNTHSRGVSEATRNSAS